MLLDACADTIPYADARPLRFLPLFFFLTFFFGPAFFVVDVSLSRCGVVLVPWKRLGAEMKGRLALGSHSFAMASS